MTRSCRRLGLASIVIVLIGGWAQAETGLGRHQKLYAVPAPSGSKVVVDSKLGDWDLCGRIEMFFMSETTEMQSAKFAVMYDADVRYTFEYRIPWSTLNAMQPPKGGDLVAGTVQFNWGKPDGLGTAGA